MTSRLLSIGLLAASAACAIEPPLETVDWASGKADGPPLTVAAPRRVVLFPLIKQYYWNSHRDTWEAEAAWFRRTASLLESYYRKRGATTVVRQDLRTWPEFFEFAGRQGSAFDRVVFLGHGGFDGPLTTMRLLDARFARGSIEKTYEDQPGVRIVYRWTYDAVRFPQLVAYVEAEWSTIELATVGPEISSMLDYQVPQDQRIQPGCVSSCVEEKEQAAQETCQQDCASTCAAEEAPATCTDSCAVECLADKREYFEYLCTGRCSKVVEATKHQEADLERYVEFAAALVRMTSAEGAIVLGHCNGATPFNPATNLGGLLVPELGTYGQMLADDTERIVAAAVGKTTLGEDFVTPLKALENGADPPELDRYLPW